MVLNPLAIAERCSKLTEVKGVAAGMGEIPLLCIQLAAANIDVSDAVVPAEAEHAADI
jgi:hypothetical protein